MSIPFSRANTPSAPPMPSKAAQLLGTDTGVTANTSPSSMRRNPPRHIKSTPRSDTSKSLPAKILDHHGHSRRPNQYGSPRARNRMPSHQMRTSEKAVHGGGPKALEGILGSSSSLGNPPTPPAKDTPRDIKAKVEPEGPTIPNFFTPAKPVSSSGGRSPTKFCPYTAEDYAQLIELHPVLSVHGQVGCTEPEGVVSELEGDTEYPDLNEALVVQMKEPQERDELQKNYSPNKLNGEGLLKPAFYSPDSFAASLFEGGRPSHNVSTCLLPSHYLHSVAVACDSTVHEHGCPFFTTCLSRASPSLSKFTTSTPHNAQTPIAPRHFCQSEKTSFANFSLRFRPTSTTGSSLFPRNSPRAQ